MMKLDSKSRANAYWVMPAGDAALGDHPEGIASRAMEVPAFDAMDFDAMRDMVGETGIGEMVGIFETETRRRLRRLATGMSDAGTLVREMHTLKGSAGMVGSPRLTAFGEAFERAAHWGVKLTPDDLKAMEDALEAYLASVRARNDRRAFML
jgi:HPt (histidine-containing phosphotransfer) domain-containing protein